MIMDTRPWSQREVNDVRVGEGTAGWRGEKAACLSPDWECIDRRHGRFRSCSIRTNNDGPNCDSPPLRLSASRPLPDPRDVVVLATSARLLALPDLRRRSLCGG